MENKENYKSCLYVIIVLLSFILLFSILTYTKVNGNVTSGSNVVEEEVEYDVSKFKSLNETQFVEALNSKKLQITYLGRKGCHFCVQFVPIMNQAMAYLEKTFNYVDISAVDNTKEEYNTMKTTIDTYFNENHSGEGITYGTTPMVLVTQKGKILYDFVGAGEYDTFLKWLEETVKI